MGIQESKDVKTMINYLQSLGIEGEKIGLYGRSLGGASSLIAFLETPSIKAAVLDSAFTDHIKIIKAELKKSKVPSFLLWGGLFAGKHFFRVNLLEKNIFSLLENKKSGSLFLIHGHKDTVIPISHSKELKAAIEKEKKLTVKTWFHDYPGHSDGLFHAPKEHSQQVISFFNRQLKRK